MKKIAFALGIVFLALTACNKADPAPEHLSFDLTVNFENATKSVQTGWEAGNQIIVFFDKEIASTPRYLVMQYDGSKWTYSFNESTLEPELLGKTSGTLSAAYVPFVKSWEVTESSGRYKIAPKDKNGNKVCAYYLKATNITYDVSGSKLTATLDFSLDGYDSYHFYIPETTGEPGQFMMLGGSDYNYSAALSWFKDDGTFAAQSNPTLGYPYDGGISFFPSLSVSPVTLSADAKIYVDDTINNKRYTYTIPAAKVIKKGSNIKLPKLSDSKWIVSDLS